MDSREASIGSVADAPRRSAVADLTWTRILDARRRDRRTILPMSLVSLAGAVAWQGWAFALAWFGGVLAAVVITQQMSKRIQRDAEPGQRWEHLMAVASGVNTLMYSALPVALCLNPSAEAIAVGVMLFAAMAISAGEEVVISRPIGLASLGVILIAALTSMALCQLEIGWLRLILIVAAMICLIFYILQAAQRRHDMEVRAARALDAAVEKEQEAAVANAAKSTFLATISHEIRTPLNGVLGMAQAMAAEELADPQRERLEVIRRSGEALTEILNDVLDLSKIEAGRLTLETVAFDLDAVLADAVEPFRARAAEKGLGLVLSLSPQASGHYRGDPTRIRQVISNLVSNAVKFTAKGHVAVEVERGEREVRFSVRDTGPGISAAGQARLFRKFEQLDDSTTRRHGGTGLGLAICRELCELMGGGITVDSAEGAGAVFTVRLPLRRIASPQTESPQDASPSGAEAEAGAGPSAPSPERRLRVLAAEDNEVNRLVLVALLAQVGLTPTVVTDGAQAVAAWAADEWDLILMDVHMPVMDGIAAVREIRAQEAARGLARTPVIALTANAMIHQIAELTEAGMDAHVAKPIEVARLFEAIALVTA